MSATDARNETTPNYGLNKPLVGGDDDIWGDLLNDNADTLDEVIAALDALVHALSQNLVLVGAYDVAGDLVTPVAGTGAVAGPLPPPSAGNAAWYVIVQVPGTGTGNAPARAMKIGDWLISNGTEWLYYSMGISEITADGVAITAIPGLAATEVQTALELLQSNKLGQVYSDNISLVGSGTQADPLVVDRIDGGAYATALGHEWQAAALSDQQRGWRVLHHRRGPG